MERPRQPEIKLWYIDPAGIDGISDRDRRIDLIDQVGRLVEFGVLREVEPAAVIRMQEAAPGVPLRVWKEAQL